jgi:hypothetical protein
MLIYESTDHFLFALDTVAINVSITVYSGYQILRRNNVFKIRNKAYSCSLKIIEKFGNKDLNTMAYRMYRHECVVKFIISLGITTIMFLDIIQSSWFYLKHNVSETEFLLRLSRFYLKKETEP